ncbi:MAG: hypothetical protein OES32_03445 [Acidobacteriota bacterium]|nr:hypothetical protein [Acidobacteriota bacterium]MDH3522618.1 hypothetical protein [Acidobacteriota bacterium]
MSDSTKRQRILRLAGLAGAVFLGLVLLVAAWTKAIDPHAFAEQITAEGLAGWLPAMTVARIALGLELALGLALVLGIRRRWVLVPAALLVGFFLFLTGRAYLDELRGVERAAAACGCFGNLVERTPAEAFWQDLLLLVPPLALAFLGTRAAAPFPRRRLALVAAGTLAGLGLAWWAPELPLDDLATRLAPGVETRELCAGRPADPDYVCLDALVPELDRGEHWVVLTHLDEEELVAGLERLHAHSLANGEPRLWLVSDALPEDLNAFSWQYMVATEVRLAPATLLRPLYRTLPRSFRVLDGRVVETIPGLPELGEVGEGWAAAGRRALLD